MQVAYRNLFSMGTRMDIVLPGIEDDHADRLLAIISDQLKRLEDKISNYDKDSVISVLNREAPFKPHCIDPEIFEMIGNLIDYSERTLNLFDFTIGKITGSKKNPGMESELGKKETEDIINNTGVRFLETDPENFSVKYGSASVSIDSGAFGKGAALDLIKEILINDKTGPGFISFGESSILAHGIHPWGDSWKTGICNMFTPGENVFVMELKDEFMSVSGITPLNRRKYGNGHVINPRTGNSVNNYIQSAAAGKNGLVTEVLSTALLCAQKEERAEIMKNFAGYRAVVIEYDDSGRPAIIFQQ
jgi:FAD:protein FMN transferase